MKLEPTRVEYTFCGESGYSFRVTAVKDDEWGWHAAVTMESFGAPTADDSVADLKRSAEEFLRHLAARAALAFAQAPKGGEK